jgi:hypothetical protein
MAKNSKRRLELGFLAEKIARAEALEAPAAAIPF